MIGAEAPKHAERWQLWWQFMFEDLNRWAPMKVFVSWSKEPSKKFAEEVKHLIEMTLPGTSVWMSEADIAKGARWATAISSQLEQTQVGIICCAKNNLLEPWLHFEAGALSKSVEQAMVHPLCFDVEFAELPGTLSQFQATKFERKDVLALLHSINEKSAQKAKSADVEAKFVRAWPGFEQAVKEAAANTPDSLNGPVAPPKGLADSTEELSEEERAVLKRYAESGLNLSFEDVARALNLNPIRTKHRITELRTKEYLNVAGASNPPKYKLSKKGLAYVVQNGWV